jgi:hypothetical protein
MKFLKAKLPAISQVLDADAKVLKARVVLQNTNLKLKPGMIVDVTALKELKTEALSISTSAMVFDNNQNYVVVHKSDCEIEIRLVEILTKSNGITFLSGGLSENEKIISKNHLLIYEQIKNFPKLIEMQKFVQGIVAFSLKNSIIVFFLTALLVVAGVISYINTPIEAFPDVTNTRARIITQWPGRSAEEVEKFVTLRIMKADEHHPEKSRSTFHIAYLVFCGYSNF